jgi:hypothetical protein
MKIEYRASRRLRLTSRLDFAMRTPAAGDARKRSLAASQEAQWKLHDDLLLTARYTLFDAPGSTPIYQYEHDLPGVFTNFALREQGRRAYIYLRYFSTFGFDLSLKLACIERERSIFEYARSCAWGAQIDWRLSQVRP